MGIREGYKKFFTLERDTKYIVTKTGIDHKPLPNHHKPTRKQRQTTSKRSQTTTKEHKPSTNDHKSLANDHNKNKTK